MNALRRHTLYADRTKHRRLNFVVNGMTIHADANTDYDDELKNFSDLQVGQRVEVDYVMHNGKHHAKEIELDD